HLVDERTQRERGRAHAVDLGVGEAVRVSIARRILLLAPADVSEAAGGAGAPPPGMRGRLVGDGDRSLGSVPDDGVGAFTQAEAGRDVKLGSVGGAHGDDGAAPGDLPPHECGRPVDQVEGGAGVDAAGAEADVPAYRVRTAVAAADGGVVSRAADELLYVV